MNEEKAIVVAAPLPPHGPDLSAVAPPKRRKGRPPKNHDLMPVGENWAASLPPKPDGRGRKPKRKNGDPGWPAVDSAFVGQQVHGVLDGSFDAGYLLTVRVGNTQTILRGAVFEPALSVPVSQANDVAPHVNFITRNEQAVSPSPGREDCSANPSLPPSVGPSLNLGIPESACVCSEVVPHEMAPVVGEQDRPSEVQLSDPSLIPTVATTQYHRDGTAFLAKDDQTEEKIELQSEQQLQQDVTAEAFVS